MSIHNEKEYERFKYLIYLDKKGTPDDPGLYWVARFLWSIDPTELPDNKAAVAAVRHVTEKLQKNPQWQNNYELQLQLWLTRTTLLRSPRKIWIST